MRTIEEVTKDYAVLCQQLGNLEYTFAIQKEEFVKKMKEINQEGAEIQKAKAEEAPKEEPKVDPAIEVSNG